MLNSWRHKASLLGPCAKLRMKSRNIVAGISLRDDANEFRIDPKIQIPERARGREGRANGAGSLRGALIAPITRVASVCLAVFFGPCTCGPYTLGCPCPRGYDNRAPKPQVVDSILEIGNRVGRPSDHSRNLDPVSSTGSRERRRNRRVESHKSRTERIPGAFSNNTPPVVGGSEGTKTRIFVFT